jgi:hypothetical protein
MSALRDALSGRDEQRKRSKPRAGRGASGRSRAHGSPRRKRTRTEPRDAVDRDRAVAVRGTMRAAGGAAAAAGHRARGSASAGQPRGNAACNGMGVHQRAGRGSRKTRANAHECRAHQARAPQGHLHHAAILVIRRQTRSHVPSMRLSAPPSTPTPGTPSSRAAGARAAHGRVAISARRRRAAPPRATGRSVSRPLSNTALIRGHGGRPHPIPARPVHHNGHRGAARRRGAVGTAGCARQGPAARHLPAHPARRGLTCSMLPAEIAPAIAKRLGHLFSAAIAG